MELSLIVKQILGEIDHAAEALENKPNCNVLLLAFHNYAYIQRDVMDVVDVVHVNCVGRWFEC
jgi:hypothetical protein